MSSFTVLQLYNYQQPKQLTCQSSDFRVGMSSNAQVRSTFDGTNIAAEPDRVSEPEDTFKELLLAFIVDVNCFAG